MFSLRTYMTCVSSWVIGNAYTIVHDSHLDFLSESDQPVVEDRNRSAKHHPRCDLVS